MSDLGCGKIGLTKSRANEIWAYIELGAKNKLTICNEHPVRLSLKISNMSNCFEEQIGYLGAIHK